MHTELFQYKYLPAPQKIPEDRLLVGLHGLGDSYEGYTWMPSALNVPGLDILLLNAPDPYFTGYSWYDFEGNQEEGILRSRSLLLQLLEELEKQGRPPEKTVLFGFSQGSLMCLDVGLRAPKKLAGICGVSGYLAFPERVPGELSPAASSQHFLLTHGEYDPVIPFEPVTKQYRALQELGLQVEFKSYPKDHTILPEELADIRQWLMGILKMGQS